MAKLMVLQYPLFQCSGSDGINYVRKLQYTNLYIYVGRVGAPIIATRQQPSRGRRVMTRHLEEARRDGV